MTTNNIKLEEINIRTTLKPGDIGYVIYMHGKIYHKEYGYGVIFDAYVAQGFYEFYKNYDSVLDCVWVAEHNEKVIGFLLLMHREPEEAQLRYFILEPEYRGIGLGKKLSGLYMAHLQKNGYKRSYLWTTHELFTAANIYRKMGFSLSEEIASTAFGKPLKEQRYDMVLRS
jgi:peptidyl-dipeptidase Dcp